MTQRRSLKLTGDSVHVASSSTLSDAMRISANPLEENSPYIRDYWGIRLAEVRKRVRLVNAPMQKKNLVGVGKGVLKE